MDSAVVPFGPFARSLADKYSAFGLFFARGRSPCFTTNNKTSRAEENEIRKRCHRPFFGPPFFSSGTKQRRIGKKRVAS